MFEGLFGIRLLLHLGQSVPEPASSALLSTLLRTEVMCDSSGASGFQLTFAVGHFGAPDPRAGGALELLSRVRIGVLTGAIPEMLIDGVVTHHELLPGSKNAQGTLTVTGKDLSVMLDLEERNAAYENQSDGVIVSQILGRYPELGLLSDIARTPEGPTADARVPRQAETDLEFIQRLAERNGYVFFIEPDAFGVNKAYFGPPRRGDRLAGLTFGVGASDNVTSVRASADGLAAIDVASISLDIRGASKELRAIPPDASSDEPRARARITPRRRVIHRSAASLTEGLVAATAASRVALAPDPLALEGELDFVRYGAVLKPRRVVSLFGAGDAYDGDHVVRRVRHVIEQGAYTQSFSLGREGTGRAQGAAL